MERVGSAQVKEGDCSAQDRGSAHAREEEGSVQGRK